MPLTRPVVGADISAADFGQPVYDLINQPSWSGVAFDTSVWQNYNTFAPCVYRKVGTRVELRGVAQRKGSTLGIGYGSNVFVLPAGFRPPQTLIVPSLVGYADVGIGRIDIQTDGVFKLTPMVNVPVDGYCGFTIVFWTD